MILFWVPECLFCKKYKINGIKWEVADVPKAGQSQVILKGYINKSK